MKNLLIVILLGLLISGCHLTKKVTKSEATTTQSTQTNETASAKENLKVTNNLITDQETITTVTEYYPPTEVVIPPADQDNGIVTVPVKPAVKSITITTTKAKTHDQGITEAAKEQQAAKTTTDNSSSNIKTDDIEKPAADPKRWRYIFGILVIIVGAVIYWKRATVLPWLKSVLSLSGKK